MLSGKPFHVDNISNITPQDKARQERIDKWEKIKADIPEATYSRTLESLAILDPNTNYLKAKKTLKEAKEIALVKADERIARVKAEQEVNSALKTAPLMHFGHCSIPYRHAVTVVMILVTGGRRREAEISRVLGQERS